ncbi:MAG: GPP34 family phosphoprotein [Prolixibacteraceae bacterium]|jgi:hypothetical protein
MEKSLKLSEKLFCLAVNPKRGGIFLSASSALGMTLTGSVFVELMNNEVISIENGKVHLANPKASPDEIHEFFLGYLRNRRTDRKMRNWISFFNFRKRKVQKLFIRTLVRKQVLRIEERRILFIPYEKVFLMDRELVESVRREVENAVLGKVQPAEGSLILAVLASKTNLLPGIFPDKQRRKEAAQYLKKLPETQISKAVQEAIQMAQAAAYAAIS